jgi:hypothetical protein
MLKNCRLARAAQQDAVWNQFLTILNRKAESAGFQVIEVNAPEPPRHAQTVERWLRNRLANGSTVAGVGIPHTEIKPPHK